jgi:hypothetical protein
LRDIEVLRLSTARKKIRVTGRDRSRAVLEDAIRVTTVLDLKLADHEGRRGTIRTIEWALIDRRCLEGTYAR